MPTALPINSGAGAAIAAPQRVPGVSGASVRLAVRAGHLVLVQRVPVAAPGGIPGQSVPFRLPGR